MKLFHISDILSITTGRLVSTRHMDGVYDILNFLTGDSLFTHQLPRAVRECEPWLRTQFPQLFGGDTITQEPVPAESMMVGLLAALDVRLREAGGGDRTKTIAEWVEQVRTAHGLPEMLPVYEMGADMHTRIDPIEEAEAMVGKGRVIALELDKGVA